MVDRKRTRGGVLLGALVSGALAAGALGGAPTANATCVSFFGIGNSANCTSNLGSIAIAIGTNATANATVFFGGAFAIGNYASANADNFDLAIQLGTGYATSEGLFDVAISSTPVKTAEPLGPNTFVQALGLGTLAVNLGGYGTGLVDHQVISAGIASIAFDRGGVDNFVRGGSGPFAIAASIGQAGQKVTKVRPGININNGLVIGGAAAVGKSRTTSSAAATRHHATVPTAMATNSRKR